MCGRNIISAIKLRERVGELFVTDKIYSRNPQRKRHHLEIFTLALRNMVCRPVDWTDLDQDWEKKRTLVNKKGNFWLENFYCIY